MRLRFPIPVAILAGAVGLGAISIAGAQAPTLQPAANNEVALTVNLNGANEVPGPGDTDGTGTASVVVNTATGVVCVNFTSTNIDAMTAMHIHPGAVGVTNPPVVDFAVTSGTSAAKCVQSTAVQAAAIAAAPSSFYLNAHNAAFPNGAIRGQLALRGAAAGDLNLLDEPLRAYDSRPATSADGKLVAGTPRVVDLSTGRTGAGASVAAVPAGARAAVVTITVTQTVGVGFVTAYSNSLTVAPATSTVNWRATDQDVATTTTVAVDGSGKIQLRAGDNITHVIVDVIGYYL